jgi:hypothetical protein
MRNEKTEHALSAPTLPLIIHPSIFTDQPMSSAHLQILATSTPSAYTKTIEPTAVVA